MDEPLDEFGRVLLATSTLEQQELVDLKQMFQSALKSLPVFWAIAFLLAYVIVEA